MNRYARILLSAAFAVCLAVTGGVAEAASNVRPSHANAYGEGYGGLSAAWLEWVLAIPSTGNPLLDADGSFAGVDQSGKVWFLVGTTTGGSVRRTIAVPVGTALFFPIVNFFWVNTPEYGDPAWSAEQEAAVRQFLAQTVDSAQDLVLEIDGQAVPDLDRLRVSGAVGACTLPDDNIFGIPFDPVPHACVADGYWALLAPLSAGTHTIHFAGQFSSGFALDVTYEIAVTGR